MISDVNSAPGDDGADPRPAAVTFVTTEHFTPQGARAATIAESTGRATMFTGSVSAGLVGVVTAVLAGSAVGLLAAIAANHSAVAGFVAGGIAALVTLIALMHVQSVAWKQIAQHRYFEGD